MFVWACFRFVFVLFNAITLFFYFFLIVIQLTATCSYPLAGYRINLLQYLHNEKWCVSKTDFLYQKQIFAIITSIQTRVLLMGLCRDSYYPPFLERARFFFNAWITSESVFQIRANDGGLLKSSKKSLCYIKSVFRLVIKKRV